MYVFFRATLFSFALFFSESLCFANVEEGYLGTQLRIQSLFKKHKSSIVRVKATRETVVKGKTKRLLKMGSGFFVSKDGHILTTGFLLGADRVWIEHNKEYFLTETLGTDTLCNLTLLKTLKKPEKFNFVSFSNDHKVTPVGSFLLGLTCALEFQISPTIGLMQSSESAFGRTIFPTKMFRTSFDLNGNFIGITHAA
jgi:S1-C subfamily serine protease